MHKVAAALFFRCWFYFFKSCPDFIRTSSHASPIMIPWNAWKYCIFRTGVGVEWDEYDVYVSVKRFWRGCDGFRLVGSNYLDYLVPVMDLIETM